MPLKMFRRKLIGLRDSLVAGSLWRADFKKALEIFPEFELVQMECAFLRVLLLLDFVLIYAH